MDCVNKELLMVDMLAICIYIYSLFTNNLSFWEKQYLMPD